MFGNKKRDERIAELERQLLELRMWAVSMSEFVKGPKPPTPSGGGGTPPPPPK